jgi:hypothetical protein
VCYDPLMSCLGEVLWSLLLSSMSSLLCSPFYLSAPECWQLTNWLTADSQLTDWLFTDCFLLFCFFFCQVKVKVTLRLTVSQSLSLGVEPHLGLMTRYLLLFDSYGLLFVGRPLWREDGSAFCICCWPLPAQSFSGPSPLVLATIFYCLRFETSLVVASYDSQGHGAGIRPRLHAVFFNRVFASGIEDTFSHGCIFRCNNLVA